MDISSDFSDLFKTLNKHRVKYLVAGAYAVIYHTEPRFTKDLDVWVKADRINAVKLYKALHAFGAPLKNLSLDDLTNENLVYQIGVAPVRIDIIMGLGGLPFDSAWKSRVRSSYGRMPINIMGIRHLIAAKKRAGRPQDLMDLEKLRNKISKAARKKRNSPLKTIQST